MPIKTIKYDAEPVSVEDELALCQIIRLGGFYYRRLAVLENEHRKEIKALDASDTIMSQLLARFPTEGDALVPEMRARRLELARTEGYQIAVKVLQDKSRALKKVARTASGLSNSWATYQLIEEAHDRARMTTQWPSDLKTFARLDEGTVAVHAQGKRVVTRGDLVSIEVDVSPGYTAHHRTWSYARIDPEPYGLGRREPAGYVDNRWMAGHARRARDDNDRGRSGWLGAKRYQELRIRVGSDGRAPIWARLHVLMLAPPTKQRAGRNLVIPEGKITWVRVHRRRIGIRYSWSVQIVVEEENRPARPAAKADLVAVDLRCGRRIEGGRLLAYAIGSDGQHHELMIPDHHLVNGKSRGVVDYDNDKVSQLASIRANALNALIAALRSYRDTLPEDHWLREELTHAHSWKSWGRVGGLAGRWRRQRFPEDENIFTLVEMALKQDRHLLSWQAHSAEKRQHRIRGVVAQWASKLALHYGTIAIEDMKLTQLVTPDAKSDDRRAHIVAQRVQVLAPGKVREALKQYAQSYGRRYLVVSSVDNTRTCDHCGALRRMTDADIVRCDGCGRSSRVWITAATNILRRASAEVQSDVADPQVPTKKRARHTRRRLKEDRSQT